MSYFPFMIEVKGHKALVVGAGKSAKGKIRDLADFGADVTVVAPVISADVVKQGKNVNIERRVYRPGETKGYEIVVAATDNSAVNKQVAHDAARFGAICTVADDPLRGGFIFPSIIKKDRYAVAVSTDGKTPELAEKLKEVIEQAVPEKSDDIDALMGNTWKGLPTGNLRDGQKTRLADLAESTVEDGSSPDSNDQDDNGQENSEQASQADDDKAAEELTQDELSEKVSREENGAIKVASPDGRLSQAYADAVISALMAEGFRCQKVLFRESDNDTPVRLMESESGEIVITEIDDALLNGDVDIAVRRACDIPAELADQLTVAACLAREDARDVLVMRKGTDKSTAQNIAVMTPAEKVQMQRYLRSGKITLFRGNILELISMLKSGEFDAAVTDAAGFLRLHLAEDENLRYEVIPVEKSLPSAGQGIMAIEARKTGRAHDAVQALNDADTMAELLAEREFIRDTGAERRTETAAYAVLNNGMLMMKVMRFIGYRCVYFAGMTASDEGASLGKSLAVKVLKELNENR